MPPPKKWAIKNQPYYKSANMTENIIHIVALNFVAVLLLEF